MRKSELPLYNITVPLTKKQNTIFIISGAKTTRDRENTLGLAGIPNLLQKKNQLLQVVFDLFFANAKYTYS